MLSIYTTAPAEASKAFGLQRTIRLASNLGIGLRCHWLDFTERSGVCQSLEDGSRVTILLVEFSKHRLVVYWLPELQAE